MRRALVVPLLAFALASCSLGDKQAQADRIVAAVEDRLESGPVSGTISMALRPRAVDVPAGFDVENLAIDFDPTAFTSFEAAAAFVIDDAARTSRIAPLATPFPHVLFDAVGIRLLRTDAAPDDARPWLSVDYVDLDENSGSVEELGADTAYGYLAVLDPAVVLDLVAGPLAGSVQATTTAAGVRYDVNVDIPKALEDERGEAYDDDRFEQTESVLDLLKISGDVHPASVMLDEAGRLASFTLSLRVRVQRFEQADLEIAVALGGTAVPAAPPEPTPQELVLVDSLVPLRNSAARSAPEDPLGGLLGG